MKELREMSDGHLPQELVLQRLRTGKTFSGMEEAHLARCSVCSRLADVLLLGLRWAERSDPIHGAHAGPALETTLEAYLTGELDRAATVAIEARLSTCVVCRAHLDLLSQELEAWEIPTAPPPGATDEARPAKLEHSGNGGASLTPMANRASVHRVGRPGLAHFPGRHLTPVRVGTLTGAVAALAILLVVRWLPPASDLLTPTTGDRLSEASWPDERKAIAPDGLETVAAGRSKGAAKTGVALSVRVERSVRGGGFDNVPVEGRAWLRRGDRLQFHLAGRAGASVRAMERGPDGNWNELFAVHLPAGGKLVWPVVEGRSGFYEPDGPTGAYLYRIESPGDASTPSILIHYSAD